MPLLVKQMLSNDPEKLLFIVLEIIEKAQASNTVSYVTIIDLNLTAAWCRSVIQWFAKQYKEQFREDAKKKM